MKTGRTDGSPAKREYPTLFQIKTLWIAISAGAMLATAVIAVYTVYVVTNVLQFFQPVLVPVAFAGILAYLLEPLITRLVVKGTPRFRAVVLIWLGFHSMLLLLFISVAVPTISRGATFISDESDGPKEWAHLWCRH